MIEFLRKLVLRDFLLKIFSLAVAVLLWVLVSIAVREQPTPGMPAPARPSNLAHGLAIFHLPLQVVSFANESRSFTVTPAEVGVTVQADTNALANLRDTDLRALVVLTGNESGAQVRKAVEISAPPGVSWVRVTPAEAQVTVKP